MIEVNWTVSTAGEGYWSTVALPVRVERIHLGYVNKDLSFGELRVYFDTKTWSVDDHGLIYTDGQWLDELKDQLFLAGFDTVDVGYSEQGMQGDDYVSLDVGAKFISSWRRMMQRVAIGA
jgi:hypothetical protein